jgi:signal transduction histidine kinase
MSNLYVKNFLVTALLILISFLLLGSAFLPFTYRYLAEDKEARLDSVAQSITSYSEAYMFAGSLQIDMDFNIVVSTVASVGDCHILVANEKGRILVSSEGPMSSDIGRIINNSVMSQISGGGRFSAIGNLGGVYQGAHFIVGLPIKSSTGTVAGAVFVSSPASGLTNLFRIYMSIFFGAAVLTLIAAFILAYVVSRRMARPLRVMASAAHEFAHGKFGARVPIENRKDEIGELTHAFNSMADAMEKAEQLRRDFVANVSHELKTPMTTIAGFIDGILDGTIEQSRQNEYLTIIRDEVHRLSRLVRRMLDIARLQSGAVELTQQRFDINETVCRTLLNFESRAEAKNLDVKVDLSDKDCFVQADPDSIAQVTYNLIDNAIKFADAGSVLEISVYKNGPKAYVSVANAGEPISQDELPYVFDRFHKADKSRGIDREGMGLGLYIVKVILNSHNQDVWAESSDRKTKFIFSLRLAD